MNNEPEPKISAWWPSDLSGAIASFQGKKVSMLVLTRKLDQAIHIGPDITVQVVRLENGQVRLGIIAPDEVVILRAELGRPESPRDEEGGQG